MAGTSERRTLVNLSVVTGSAVMLTASWLGIVRADTGGTTFEEVSTTQRVAAPYALTPWAAPTPPPAMAAAAAEAGTSLQAAPASAPRRVVVVRRSRAS